MQKLNNISLLRLFATLIIFVFHCFYFTGSLDLSERFFPLYFGVNIFLFITAFLYANKPIKSLKDFFSKQYLKILAPAILILAIFFLLELVVNVEILNHIDGYFAITNMWYVPVILICYATIPLLNILTDRKSDKIVSKKIKIISRTILGVLLLSEFLLSLCFKLQVVFACFIISFLLVKNLNGNFTKKIGALRGWTLFLAFYLIFIVTGFLQSTTLLTNLPVPEPSFIATLIQHYMFAGMGITFSIAFIETFKFINGYQKTQKFFEATNRYSYSFFLVQQILLTGLFSMLALTSSLFINLTLIIITVCVLAFVIDNLSKLIINSILSKKNRRTVSEHLNQIEKEKP